MGETVIVHAWGEGDTALCGAGLSRGDSLMRTDDLEKITCTDCAPQLKKYPKCSCDAEIYYANPHVYREGRPKPPMPESVRLNCLVHGLEARRKLLKKSHDGKILVAWEVSVSMSDKSLARLMRAILKHRGQTLDTYCTNWMAQGYKSEGRGGSAIVLLNLPEGTEREFATEAQADMRCPSRVVVGMQRLPPDPYPRLFKHADWVRGKGLEER